MDFTKSHGDDHCSSTSQSDEHSTLTNKAFPQWQQSSPQRSSGTNGTRNTRPRTPERVSKIDQIDCFSKSPPLSLTNLCGALPLDGNSANTILNRLVPCLCLQLKRWVYVEFLFSTYCRKSHSIRRLRRSSARLRSVASRTTHGAPRTE